jgi:autonomous glycyl radical cofactor GrcA
MYLMENYRLLMEISVNDTTLEAIWVVDSETGERKLLNIKTGEDITPKEVHS